MTGIRYRCEPGPVALRGVTPVATVLSVPRAMTGPAKATNRALAPAHPAALAGVPHSAPASSGARTQRVLDGLRILVVEDDDDAREMLSIIFFNAGALVESAASAADGFHAIYNSQPQLLVSDIGMPDEDGYSLMRRIRALQAREGGDILAIALSAFTRPEDRMRALRAGFTIHIAKPVGPADLVAAVADVAALMEHRGRRLDR